MRTLLSPMMVGEKIHLVTGPSFQALAVLEDIDFDDIDFDKPSLESLEALKSIIESCLTYSGLRLPVGSGNVKQDMDACMDIMEDILHKKRGLRE